MEDIDYSTISPGIRELVRELREEHGLETTDSGDGTNHKMGMECSFKERHVFMQVDVTEMLEITKGLSIMYPEAHLECSWSPGQTAIVSLWPDGQPLPDEWEEEDTSPSYSFAGWTTTATGTYRDGADGEIKYVINGVTVSEEEYKESLERLPQV